MITALPRTYPVNASMGLRQRLTPPSRQSTWQVLSTDLHCDTPPCTNDYSMIRFVPRQSGDLGDANMKTVSACFASVFAASLCLGTAPCADAASFTTSYDCTKATAKVEKLICGDAQLAQMDIELMRLYRLALTDENSVPRPDKVALDQQFWVDARNQCASQSDIRTCTIASYAKRAHQLRQGSAIVRTKDPSRLTEGPLAYRCAGLNALIAATFFTTQPGVVFLTWANSSVTLNQVPSELGTQYTGKDLQGSYSFRQDGNSAYFQKPGSGGMSCSVEPTG